MVLYNPRKKYVALKDFDMVTPVGVDTVIYSYLEGDTMMLKPNGSLATKYTKNGCIKRIED